MIVSESTQKCIFTEIGVTMEWTKSQYCDLYKKLGWTLVPCKNKKAIVKWGDSDPDMSKYDLDTIEIAVATGQRSNIFTVDADGLRGQENEETKEFIKKIEAVNTRKYKTRSGNWQYVFMCPNHGRLISNKQDVFTTKTTGGYGVDVRGEGGYTILPPTVGYSWLNNEKIKEAPEWLINQLDSPVVDKVSRTQLAELPEDIGRHEWFMREVGLWFSHGWTYDKVLTQARLVNNGLDDPLPEEGKADKALVPLIDRIYKLHLKQKERKLESSGVVTEANNWLTQIKSDIMDRPPLVAPKFTTGFHDLDRQIWGFPVGKLTVIAGNPSAGKSLITQLSMLENIKANKKCLMFSAEMTKADTLTRWAIHEHGVDSDHFLSKQFTEREKVSITDLIKWLQTKEFMIYDDMIGIQQIEKLTKSYKPEIIYIDYFQDCVFEKEGFQCAEDFVYRLRDIAKRLNIPVVLASQVTEKWILKKKNEPPYESKWVKVRINCNDVRTTRALYHKADLIILLTNYDAKETGQFFVLLDVGKNKINGKKPVHFFELDRNSLHYNRITRDRFNASVEEGK